MAILKIIHAPKKYWDAAALRDVISYCTSPLKTNGLVGAYAVSTDPEQAIMQMQLLQTCLGQDRGIHLRHMVLSFDPQEKLSPGQAFQIGQEVSKYYGYQYQMIFGVHCDQPHLHIHFVMNSVNYRTGRKYRGDSKDFDSFLQHIQAVLSPFGIHINYIPQSQE